MREPRAAAHGHWPLYAVIASFVLPIVAAAALYFAGWHPRHTLNHGELITPPRPVGDIVLKTQQGKPFALGELKGTWVMLYFAGDHCGATCRYTLYAMRQVQRAQGEYAGRIRRVVLVAPGTAIASQAYPHLLVLEMLSDRAALRARFAAGAAPEGRVYVLDPLGNLAMWYPPHADPMGMIKDFQRLLQVSQIG